MFLTSIFIQPQYFVILNFKLNNSEIGKSQPMLVLYEFLSDIEKCKIFC